MNKYTEGELFDSDEKRILREAGPRVVVYGLLKRTDLDSGFHYLSSGVAIIDEAVFLVPKTVELDYYECYQGEKIGLFIWHNPGKRDRFNLEYSLPYDDSNYLFIPLE